MTTRQLQSSCAQVRTVPLVYSGMPHLSLGIHLRFRLPSNLRLASLPYAPRVKSGSPRGGKAGKTPRGAVGMGGLSAMRVLTSLRPAPCLPLQGLRTWRHVASPRSRTCEIARPSGAKPQVAETPICPGSPWPRSPCPGSLSSAPGRADSRWDGSHWCVSEGGLQP